MLARFKRDTVIVLLVLGVVVAIAWLYGSGEHFVRVSSVCYGYLLGWLGAWAAQYSYSRSQLRR